MDSSLREACVLDSTNQRAAQRSSRPKGQNMANFDIFESFTNLQFIGSLTVVILVSLYFLIVKGSKNNFPPSYGWIPFIGCAVEFGKQPLYFINEAKEKVCGFI